MVELALFFLIALLAEILGTIGGFGSSVFFVSLSQFFYDFQLVLALTGLLHIFSNTAKLIFFRKSINWKLTVWLGITSVVFASAGALLINKVDFIYAKLILGIFLIGFSILFFVRPSFALLPSLRNSLIGGSIAGFLAGFIGTGGAIRGLVLASFNLEKNLLVGTSAAIDFGVDLSRTLIYLDNNYLQTEHWVYLPLLIGAAFLGTYLGKALLNKLSQETFKKTLLVLILSIGFILTIEEIQKLVNNGMD
jgi:uncharacterized protein